MKVLGFGTRSICIAILLVLSLTVLCACGETAETEEETSTAFYTPKDLVGEPTRISVFSDGAEQVFEPGSEGYQTVLDLIRKALPNYLQEAERWVYWNDRDLLTWKEDGQSAGEWVCDWELCNEQIGSYVRFIYDPPREGFYYSGTSAYGAMYFQNLVFPLKQESFRALDGTLPLEILAMESNQVFGKMKYTEEDIASILALVR